MPKLPKRLRAYFTCDRRRLGLLNQLATQTLRAYDARRHDELSVHRGFGMARGDLG